MRAPWDRRPSPFAPAHPGVFTAHYVPSEDQRAHVTTGGADCWCEPQTQWCDERCCRIIRHRPEGVNG